VTPEKDDEVTAACSLSAQISARNQDIEGTDDQPILGQPQRGATMVVISVT
jgi:hypothetical protein